MKTTSKKNKILEAALTLFFEKGFYNTSIRDITAKAGINVSMVSYYFASKTGILDHFVDLIYKNLSSVLDAYKQNELPLSTENKKKLLQDVTLFMNKHEKIYKVLLIELQFENSVIIQKAGERFGRILEDCSELLLSPDDDKRKLYFLIPILFGLLQSHFFMKPLLKLMPNTTFDENYYNELTQVLFGLLIENDIKI
jgi:TetR/AcrR family transcriptional regulator, regulator of cefoperazone and chloramphenicol sensitivity